MCSSDLLSMIEAGVLRSRDWTLARPVAEMHAVSHDASLQHRMRLGDGRTLTAVQLQWELLEAASSFCSRSDHAEPDPQTSEVLALWEEVLTALESDPLRLADRLDWVAKLTLLEGFRSRDGLEWSSPRLALIDLQYSDLRPERGLAARLEQRGALKRMFDDEQVAAAVARPPEDTRAWFRGECVRRYGDAVAAASWDSVVLDVPGRDSLLRIPTLEPLRGTKAHVGALLDDSADVASLIEHLAPDSPR